MEVVDWHIFRVTRNADFEVEEDRDEDLLQAMERELARRRFGPPVRLEIAERMSDHVLDLLLRELDVDPHDVVEVPGLLDLSCLWQLHALPRSGAEGRAVRPRDAPGPSARAEAYQGCVHHAFVTVTSWCTIPTTRSPPVCSGLSSRPPWDPQVLAIKQTLYRVGDFPMVEALAEAVEDGKQVAAMVD